LSRKSSVSSALIVAAESCTLVINIWSACLRVRWSSTDQSLETTARKPGTVRSSCSASRRCSHDAVTVLCTALAAVTAFPARSIAVASADSKSSSRAFSARSSSCAWRRSCDSRCFRPRDDAAERAAARAAEPLPCASLEPACARNAGERRCSRAKLKSDVAHVPTTAVPLFPSGPSLMVLTI
jgi:hypothetical protein